MKQSKKAIDKPLKELIVNRGYNIRQFCREVSISEALLYKAMAGTTDLTMDKSLRIAKCLKISLKQLCELLGKDVTGIPNDE